MAEPRALGGSRPLHVLGFMTGTSLDAVDLAMIETDGEEVFAWGPTFEAKLGDDVREIVLAATEQALASGGVVASGLLQRAEESVTTAHIEAVCAFIEHHRIAPSSIDLIGVHGQTIFHAPPTGGANGRTTQIIGAERLATELGVPVCHDFRSADMAAGGQGAPLAPVYHRALVRSSKMALPAAVLNLGGVANITRIEGNGAIEAFDAGPANGMLDQLMQQRAGRRADFGGAAAAAGKSHTAIVDKYLSEQHFRTHGPRSLDRYAFSLDRVAGLALEDAAATLTDFAARAIGDALRACGQMPSAVIATGGGRHNPSLMAAIRRYCPCPVKLAEELGWRGDSIEAEAFAMLAVRTMRSLPISFPSTTGVLQPMAGGRIAYPQSGA